MEQSLPRDAAVGREVVGPEVALPGLVDVEGALVGRFREGAFISITVMPVPSEQMFSTFEIVLEVLDLEEVGS